MLTERSILKHKGITGTPYSVFSSTSSLAASLPPPPAPSQFCLTKTPSFFSPPFLPSHSTQIFTLLSFPNSNRPIYWFSLPHPSLLPLLPFPHSQSPLFFLLFSYSFLHSLNFLPSYSFLLLFPLSSPLLLPSLSAFNYYSSN